jgi:hypothetical protein
MSADGEGSGRFKLVIRKNLRADFAKLPTGIQTAIKARITSAFFDPVAARVVFAEGQGVSYGQIQDLETKKIYYITLRYAYDPQSHVLMLVDCSKPIENPGPH